MKKSTAWKMCLVVLSAVCFTYILRMYLGTLTGTSSSDQANVVGPEVRQSVFLKGTSSQIKSEELPRYSGTHISDGRVDLRQLDTSVFNFDGLEARAAQDDRNAACLIFAVSRICGKIVDVDSWNAVILQHAGEPDDVNRRAAVDLLVRTESFQNREVVCAHFGDTHAARMAVGTLRAARLGVKSAAVAYFSAPGLKRSDGSIDVVLVNEYRREALAMLDSAARGGSVEALKLLFDAHLVGEHYVGAVKLNVPIDKAKMIALGVELAGITDLRESRYYRRELRKIMTQMTPNDWNRFRNLVGTYSAARPQPDSYQFYELGEELKECDPHFLR